MNFPKEKSWSGQLALVFNVQDKWKKQVSRSYVPGDSWKTGCGVVSLGGTGVEVEALLEGAEDGALSWSKTVCEG